MALANYETNVGRGPWKWGMYVRSATKTTVAALLWTLHDMGGTIEDPSGRAAGKLSAMAVSRGMAPHPSHQSGGGALSQLMGELDTGRFAGCIAREGEPRRTSKITLLLTPEEMPPRPYVRPTAPEPDPAPAVQRSVFVQPVEPLVDLDAPIDGGTGPRPADEPTPMPEPHPGPGGEPRPDDPNVELAVAPEPVEEVAEPTIPPLILLNEDDDPIARLFKIQNDLVAATMAVATMATPIVEQVISNADPEQAERLSKTLEENNRLRAKINDLTETMRAKTKENEAYRKQILILQNNLKAIQEASSSAGDRERNLAKLNGNQRFISARPEPAIAARR